MRVLVVLALLLAGCASAPVDDVAVEVVDVELRGVVVDDAVRPVAGALVAVLGHNLSVLTDDVGRFSFDVAPGTYTLEVTKEGHLAAHVEWVAGEGGNVLLPLDPDLLPYIQESTFSGFIECGSNLVGFCAIPAFGTGTVCDAGGPCAGNPMSDNIWALLAVDPEPAWVQAEASWESTQPLGDELVMFLSHATEDQVQAGTHNGDLTETKGPSPIVATIGAPQAKAAGLGAPYGVMPRVFAGPVEDLTQCVGATCAGLGIAVQQEFEVFLHSFYHMEPPANWQFTRDGIPTN